MLQTDNNSYDRYELPDAVTRWRYSTPSQISDSVASHHSEHSLHSNSSFPIGETYKTFNGYMDRERMGNGGQPSTPPAERCMDKARPSNERTSNERRPSAPSGEHYIKQLKAEGHLEVRWLDSKELAHRSTSICIHNNYIEEPTLGVLSIGGSVVMPI